MTLRKTLLATTILAACAAPPAIAQTDNAQTGDTQTNAAQAGSAQMAIDTARAPLPLSEWKYEDLYNNAWRAEALLGMEVYGTAGEEIGDIENIIISPDGKIDSIIVESGGFLDIGDTHFRVSWDQLEWRPGKEGVIVPVRNDNIADFSLFDADEVKTADGAQSNPRAFRLTELVGDYVRLNDGKNYGYVEDVLIGKDGSVRSVVVRQDIASGAYGRFAYPYYGYEYGYDPGAGYYDLPYKEVELSEIDRFDYSQVNRPGTE